MAPVKDYLFFGGVPVSDDARFCLSHCITP